MFNSLSPKIEDSIDRSSLDGTQKISNIGTHFQSFGVLEEMKARFKDFTIASSITEIGDIYYLEPQEEGGYVSFSVEYSGAVGQGETEEEAIADLMIAIQLLKEVMDEDASTEGSL